MNALAEKICDDILEFPIDERVEIIDRLLNENSFNQKKNIERAWLNEVNQRVESIENGTSSLVSGNEVFAKVQKRFNL